MGFNRKPKDHKDPAEPALSHPYTRLTPDCVIDAVESTGRFSDARILALNSYENRVYQVGIEDEKPVIVKFYRPNRWTAEQIDEEHRFTRMLLEQELPVVPPLDTAHDSRWQVTRELAAAAHRRASARQLCANSVMMHRPDCATHTCKCHNTHRCTAPKAALL